MKHLNIIIITGLSGSGKSTAATALEDSGYYCVDNMPVVLLPKFLELPIKSSPGISGIVFVMDLRDSDFIIKYPSIFTQLREKGCNFELFFLEADEQTLLRRFSQTRRNHPVSSKDSLADNIKEEMNQLSGLRKDADRIIDTSHYNLHKLKSVIASIVKKNQTLDTISINIMSFGYKYGVPQGADLVIDVRFLQNPYFVAELKPFSGLNSEVSKYVLDNDQAQAFLEKYLSLLDFLVPQYKNEGKNYLTIAVGCTGGRHRSVAVAMNVFQYMQEIKEKNISVTHRDIDL